MSGNLESAAVLRHGRFAAQRTPEPTAEGDCQTPSTPRPRFKIKRRYDPQHLAAPTQQFLASVAAADLPIPSIEEPMIADFESDITTPWSNMHRIEDDRDNGLDLRFGGERLATPPKTPAPSDPPSLTPSRYPDWSIDWTSSCDSSPEPESRPSTSRSTRTSRSSFSQLSSCFSDEDIHLSPGSSASEGFFCFVSAEDRQPTGFHREDGATRTKKAPWTKAMSAHLWSTYNMYLSDPRVTPFQIGKSGLPPEGVLKRVAHEAARSWKGSKAVAKPTTAPDAKSGSSTPTAESRGAFIEWPHTGAATRKQLRLLCKQKARGPDGGKMRFSYFSRSPTPFTNTTARWARKPTPGSTTTFETHEMSTSLAMSTSDTMNPKGPLAQITNSVPDSPNSITPAPVKLERMQTPDVDFEPSSEERRRLGSPINAKSYGPSSSSSLLDIFGLSEDIGMRQTRTVATRQRLQSPVRLSRSSTQKRKTGQAHEARKRPSLSTDFWMSPSLTESSRDQHRLSHKKSFSLSYGEDSLFASRSQPQLFVDTAQASHEQQPKAPVTGPQLLGSPFVATSSTSLSVPNRFSQPNDLVTSLFGRRFSTVHPSRGSYNAEPSSVNLASRLAYIDQRLKEFNQPESRRRSQSPL